MKHTALPWHVYTPDNGQDGYPHNLSIGADSQMRSTYVASIPGGAHYDYAKANAAFIVRSCNAHYELVAALEAILTWDDGTLPGDILAEAATAVAKARS